MEFINFIKSTLRKQLLRLYFAHPEKEYYLRELERILKKPVSYIRRELINLEKSGLFISQWRGKQRYFRLNRNFSLYNEIKKIVFKTIGIQGNLSQILQKIKDIKIAFIFGSFAHETEDVYSDIDVMIIGNPNEDKLISLISKFEDEIDREINYCIFDISDFKQKIKEKDQFIKNILLGKKIFLIGNENELSKIN